MAHWMLKHHESNLYLQWDSWRELDEWTHDPKLATKFSTMKEAHRIVKKLRFKIGEYIIEPCLT